MLLQRNNNPKRETYCVKYRVCTVLTDAPHTIRHGHVWAQRVTAGAGGPPPPSSFNIHTLRTRTWKWGRIYRAILLSHVVSSKCNIKKVRMYFCQATLMALYFQQKNNVTVQILPPRCLSILRFLRSSSQVVQCVQTVKNTAVQWFPTSARMLQLKKYYSCGKKRANG